MSRCSNTRHKGLKQALFAAGSGGHEGVVLRAHGGDSWQSKPIHARQLCGPGRRAGQGADSQGPPGQHTCWTLVVCFLPQYCRATCTALLIGGKACWPSTAGTVLAAFHGSRHTRLDGTMQAARELLPQACRVLCDLHCIPSQLVAVLCAWHCLDLCWIPEILIAAS